MENDDDIVEDKNVTDVDLDFEDDIVDDEKSDEEEGSDTDHNIEENKNELNEQCEYKAYDKNITELDEESDEEEESDTDHNFLDNKNANESNEQCEKAHDLTAKKYTCAK